MSYHHQLITNPPEKQTLFYGLVTGRCSSKPQLDKYGPSVQMAQAEEGTKHFPKGELKLLPELSIFVQEPASGWNRRRWELAMDQILQYFHDGKIQVLVFPRVNRETRFMAGSFGKLIEMTRVGLLVYFAQEHLLLDPADTHSIQEYTIEAIKAQGFIDALKRDCLPARADAARRGDIPSGFGRYGGCLGLRYDKQAKRFFHIPGLIDTAHEILVRYLSGESASSITKTLQSRGAMSAAGGPFHRSAVNRVLRHARVYAGVVTWDGIEIRGKVDPIISEAQADQILERLRWNKEKSLGFGKRKWLTGRVVCGVCGRRYSLDAKKGCYCGANDPRAPTHCDSPRAGWKQLQDKALELVSHTIFNPWTIVFRVVEQRKRWESQQEELAIKREGIEASLSEFSKRRRLLSFQHEHKGLTDDEYLVRLQSLQREEASVVDTIKRMSELEEPPVDLPGFEAAIGIHSVDDGWGFFQFFFALQKIMGPLIASQSNEDKEKLAEALDLKAVVYPGHDSAEPFRLEVMMRLPLEEDSCQFLSKPQKVTVSSTMVTPMSLRTEHHRHLPLLVRLNPDNQLDIETILVGAL
ncbi:hypothetical protein ES707_16498 [subsurface metagenome]